MVAAVSIRIDFVSDVACPWCAVGFASLKRALARLPRITADIHLQPFELDPEMPLAGEDAREHIMRKYGISAEESDANRELLKTRAAAVGFDYRVGPKSRVWNTFDAHRLLHWASEQDRRQALALKQALFGAYFTTNENVADHDVLVRLATAVGLDGEAARRVLAEGEYAQAVREAEEYYQRAGVHSVPATIVNGKHLIPGGQPPDVFEQALRDIVRHRKVG